MGIDQKINGLQIEIGEKINKLRTEKKLSMRELGEKLGVSHAHISKLEKGINGPSVDLLEKIAEFFDIDISYFFITKEEEQIFTVNERSLLYERDLSIKNLKEKYEPLDKLNPSDEEIQEAIKQIKILRMIKQMENS